MEGGLNGVEGGGGVEWGGDGEGLNGEEGGEEGWG